MRRKGDDSYMYCRKCGNMLMPNSAVCTVCGSPVIENAPAEAKSKMLAGLLGIFLGAFGIHNFYLGYTAKAVIQLVGTILGCIGCFFLIFAVFLFGIQCFLIGLLLLTATSIWGMVEGVLILCGKIDVDGQGNPLAE